MNNLGAIKIQLACNMKCFFFIFVSSEYGNDIYVIHENRLSIFFNEFSQKRKSFIESVQ